MKNQAMIALLALAAAWACPPAAQAEEPQPGTLGETWIVTVRLGETPQFEEALKAHLAVARQHGDPRPWTVYTPVTGDQLSRYVIRSCCFQWADLDAYAEWDRANPAVMQDWEQRVAPHVEDYAHEFNELDPANSHWPADVDATLFGVTQFRIAPGRGAQFDAVRAELSQVALNQGWSAAGRHWAWVRMIGGEPTAELIVPYANFAAMAPAGQSFADFLAQHMGAEAAAALQERLAAATAGVSYSIWALRADLVADSGE